MKSPLGRFAATMVDTTVRLSGRTPGGSPSPLPFMFLAFSISLLSNANPRSVIVAIPSASGSRIFPEWWRCIGVGGCLPRSTEILRRLKVEPSWEASHDLASSCSEAGIYVARISPARRPCIRYGARNFKDRARLGLTSGIAAIAKPKARVSKSKGGFDVESAANNDL